MPAYELLLIIKNLPRPELVQSIKRSSELILKNNGLIRSFENLGNKNLPYRMKSKDGYHSVANYLLIKFDIPRSNVSNITSEVSKDADYLRSGVSPLIEYDEEFDADCICKEKGEFVKNSFNFEKPMTVWHRKKIYKNYSIRL